MSDWRQINQHNENDKNMKTEILTITPELAKEFLAKNTKNRRLSDHHVAFLAKMMERGEWKLNGAAIILNDTRLIDGQHRLEAIVKSGVAIQSVVVQGVECSAFTTIDTGKRRNACDALGLNGYKNTAALAGAVVLVDKYFNHALFSGHCGNLKYSNQEIVDLAAKYKGITESMNPACYAKKIIPAAIGGACHYLFSRRSKSEAERFFDDLILGAGLEVGDPVLLLRNRRALEANHNRYKTDRMMIFALTIKAWNARIRGEKLKVLKVVGSLNDDTFPECITS